MNKIKKLADGHTITPRPEVWNKLKHKLKANKAKRRLIAYRNISIAAILISVLSVTAVFTMYLGKHNPKVFSSNEQYQPVMLEDLAESNEDPKYDVKNVDQLNNDFLEIDFSVFDFPLKSPQTDAAMAFVIKEESGAEQSDIQI